MQLNFEASCVSELETPEQPDLYCNKEMRFDGVTNPLPRTWGLYVRYPVSALHEGLREDG